MTEQNLWRWFWGVQWVQHFPQIANLMIKRNFPFYQQLVLIFEWWVAESEFANSDNISYYLLGLLWGLNELANVKYL